MKTGRLGIAASFGLWALICLSAHAEEILSLKATSGLLLHGGLYPSYFVFLKAYIPHPDRARSCGVRV